MKRWALLTVLLYVLTLAVLSLPVALLAFGDWWFGPGRGMALRQALTAYHTLGFWIWLGVMGLGQAWLLLAPVGLAERRPAARRRLVVPVAVASFCLANLLLAAILSALCAVFREGAFELFSFFGETIRSGATEGTAGLDYLFGMITVIGLLWLVWAVVFYRFAKADDPEALVQRTTRWLLRGSILELLVAVPSHIIVRNRDDCCAPFATFWGITTGLSIMLLSFGPGVFFLFAERFRRLQPK